MFESWLGQHTKDRNFVAFHAAAINLPLEHRLFKGQGDPEAPVVKLGCREFWVMMEKGNKSGGGASAGVPAHQYGGPMNAASSTAF